MPVLGERVALCTWCSGIGPRTAERRTTVEGDRGGAAEAVAVWAHLDPVTGVPARLGERFAEIYGPSAGPDRPDHRLRHPPPPDGATRLPWTFRAADVDVAAHVNNAVYWEALEEGPAIPAACVVEAEHRAPAVAGPAVAAARRGPHLGDEHPGRGPRVLRGQCELMTRSMRPYSAASSGLKKRSRSMSRRTSSSGLPVCFA